MSAQTAVAVSDDGVPIHYDVNGTGSPAPVFVHGWFCDRHYWDGQAAPFAPRHTIVRLDLAGHGASGRNRVRWTVPAFGQDVAAVIKHLGLKKVVLIGHSLAGGPIVEAARGLPDAVIGVIGVDTWPNLGEPLSREGIAQALAPFRADFVAATRSFVQSMFLDTADPALVERVATGMSAAPPDIALSALEEGRSYGRELQQGLRELRARKIAINARPKPTDAEAQNYGIEIMRMSGVGHFLMMEDPETFNRLLAQAVEKCVRYTTAR